MFVIFLSVPRGEIHKVMHTIYNQSRTFGMKSVGYKVKLFQNKIKNPWTKLSEFVFSTKHLQNYFCLSQNYLTKFCTNNEKMYPKQIMYSILNCDDRPFQDNTAGFKCLPLDIWTRQIAQSMPAVFRNAWYRYLGSSNWCLLSFQSYNF